MIKTEFLGLFQVRFETLQYGDPIFNKISERAFKKERKNLSNLGEYLWLISQIKINLQFLPS